MKHFVPILFTAFLVSCASLISCSQARGGANVSRADSLCHRAYTYRYRDLDSAYQFALAALKTNEGDEVSVARATNELAFVAWMRLDFEQAGRLYDKVYQLTNHPIEQLIADVGWMKICQRKSANKEFYDYHNRALKRLTALTQNKHRYTEGFEQERLRYAVSDFHIVTAIYHYYLQQHEDALAAIENQADNACLQADTAQWLYYHYIKAAASLCTVRTVHDCKLREFDELYAVYLIASREGYLYFSANALQGMANLMAQQADYEYFLKRRPYDLEQLSAPVDSLLPFRLGKQALHLFKRYNDRYQISGTYVSIARYLNAHQRYAEALDTLNVALATIGEEWEKVPECMSRIREQLTVTYAGLGDKQASDFNRNSYLDILDDTRQDKELESRYQALEAENRYLGALLCSIIIGACGLAGALWLFHRNSKRRSQKHLKDIEQMLEVCRAITSAIPAPIDGKEEMADYLLKIVRTRWSQPFENGKYKITDGKLCPTKKCRHEDKALLDVINTYIEWGMKYGLTSLLLDDEYQRQEELKIMHQLHIAGLKRRNLQKKACVAIVEGVQPFIDRIIHEVERLRIEGERALSSADRKVKYQYVGELVDTINQRNDLLAGWIKMKQGTLNLHIETFEVNSLFNLVRKSARAYQQKQITLEVKPTDAWVKADKALTLFMINTLAENARKYTPSGGKVTISAQAAENYVEIIVQDTGYGLTPEEVQCIMGKKVYDPQSLGQLLPKTDKRTDTQKGTGFGLMNCKGIIEKYRKTGAMFDVCRLGVESQAGIGSRFFFRLPQGVRQAVTVLLLFFSVPMVAGTSETEAYDHLLDIASDYANNAYYANIDGDYEQALCYVDSAISVLNEHYRKYGKEQRDTMCLADKKAPAELGWWANRYDTDYHVILDLRNESAVAALALKKWDIYQYGNTAYTSLYKLLSEDHQLEAYCNEMELKSERKLIAVLWAIMLICAFPVGYYLLYLRRIITQRKHLRQVLAINKQVFEQERLTPSDIAIANEPGVDKIYGLIVQAAGDAVARIGHKNLDVEYLQDEVRRAAWEDNQLHVQNQVLDNCLSSIKHETSYYPYKIKLLVDKLLANDAGQTEERDTVEAIYELITYYKGVFGLLSQCAVRQTAEVTFRRSAIPVPALIRAACKYFEKKSKVQGVNTRPTLSISGDVTDEQLMVTGDENELQYLFENLIEEALNFKSPGNIEIKVCRETKFVRFDFVDERRTKSAEELHQLFYPDEGCHTQYLVCKQIIREHDEYTGHSGCRMTASSPEKGGFTVTFTVKRK